MPEPETYAHFVVSLGPIRAAYERNEPATVLRLAMTLADEANRYIDEHKPWVLAKQEGADAQLQAVCTQGLNLFRVRSEEHTSELQSLMRNSYAVLRLKQKKKRPISRHPDHISDTKTNNKEKTKNDPTKI